MAVCLSAGVLLGLTGCGDDKKSSPSKTATTPAKAVPKLVSVDELKSYAGTLQHPLYWAGPRNDTSYELTRTSDGSSYIRYLPPGVGAGDPRPNFLTVGTYPRDNAYKIVENAAKSAKTSVNLPGNGLAVPSPRNPKSVFLSYPDSLVLVEIFSPNADESMRLARKQAIVPIQ